jgi:hypothetical protein
MAACGGDSLDNQYFELLDAIVAGGPDGVGRPHPGDAPGTIRSNFMPT